MSNEPFKVIDFNHGTYKFYERPNGSVDMAYIPKDDFEKFTIEHQIPTMTDLAIDESINNILGREDLIMQMNKLVLEDERERYVRALLNRLNTIIKYMERASDDDTYRELIIAIAKGDLNTIYDYEQYLDEETFEILKGYKSKGDTNE